MDEVADVRTVLIFGNYSLGRGKVETRFAESQPERADGLEAARSLAWRCNFPWIIGTDSEIPAKFQVKFHPVHRGKSKDLTWVAPVHSLEARRRAIDLFGLQALEPTCASIWVTSRAMARR